MTKNTKVNLEAIKALENAVIKTPQNQAILLRRKAQVQKEVKMLRDKTPSSRPATHCNKVADEIETVSNRWNSVDHTDPYRECPECGGRRVYSCSDYGDRSAEYGCPDCFIQYKPCYYEE